MRHFLIFGTLLLLACGGEKDENEVPSIEASSIPTEDTEITEAATAEVIGTWNMDSSAFINDGVADAYALPLVETKWIFHESGKYEVQTSMPLSGTYTTTGNTISVTLMGMTTDYEILLFDGEQLHIQSTIFEDETSSMKTNACLTRISH